MTLPLLRVLWMQSAIAAHTPLIEKSKQINLPLPFDAAIIKKHDTIATLSLFNDCFDLLSTKDPRVVEYTSANGNVRAELVVDPTLFEKFHELSLRPLIWSFALSFEGEIPDGFTFEDMFYLSAPTRRVSLKMGQIAMVQQKLGQLELSANVLVDLLNFSRLPAPEYTSGANGTVCRLIACQTLNTFLMRLSPDDLPRVRPQLQEMQHALLADSFEVEKFGRVFPVVDLYRDKPAKAYGWLLEPLAIHLQNKEIHTLIEYKTRLKSKPPSTPDLPNPNWTRQGFMGDEDKQYIPYYDSYAAYVNATSIHIASRIFTANSGRFPEKLEDLVSRYLPCIPLDYTGPTPALMQMIDDPNTPGRKVIPFRLTTTHKIFQTDVHNDAQAPSASVFWLPLNGKPPNSDDGLPHYGYPEPE